MTILIIPILIAVLLLALALWVNRKVDLPPEIKNVVNIVLVVIFVLWLINLLAGYGPGLAIRVG